MTTFGISAYHPYIPPLVDLTATDQDIALMTKATTAMDALVKNDTFLQSIAAHTLPVLPASGDLILATLWGHFDTNEGLTFNKSDVQQALADDGITDSDTVNALWQQIDPRGSTPSITSNMFANNTFITGYIKAHTDEIAADVVDVQLKGGPRFGASDSSFLSTFMSLDPTNQSSSALLNVLI